jgi:hypothetical protein
MNFTKVAQAVETVLLEKIALGEISDYKIDIRHDDNKLEVTCIQSSEIKSITFDLCIKPDKKKK